MSERVTGTIKSFNPNKGYGFIERQGGKDVFFHISAFQSDSSRTPREGQAVEFNIEERPKGLQAVNIVIIK
jgi:CspA family cold shock protein